MNKNRRKPWQKKALKQYNKAGKIINKMLKEKQKTYKIKEKVHRKASKVRKRKVERNIDRILTAGCFLLFLAAAFQEAKEYEQKSISKRA